MGDSGAFLLGMLLAVSTSVVGGRADPDTQDFIGQTFFFFAPLVHPAADPRRADPRHAVRDRAAGVEAPGARRRRQGPPAPPPDEPRARSPARRADPVGVDRAAVGLRALSGAVRARTRATCTFGIGALGIVLFTVLHPSVRRRRAEEIEAALDRPASEQLDPSRPERREAELRPSARPSVPSAPRRTVDLEPRRCARHRRAPANGDASRLVAKTSRRRVVGVARGHRRALACARVHKPGASPCANLVRTAPPHEAPARQDPLPARAGRHRVRPPTTTSAAAWRWR